MSHPAVMPILALVLTVVAVGGSIVAFSGSKEPQVAKKATPSIFIKETDEIKMRLREHEIREEVADIKQKQKIDRLKNKWRLKH